MNISCDHHCVKKVQIRSYFWSAFCCICIEYREILRISPCSVQIRGNADQNNSEYGTSDAVKRIEIALNLWYSCFFFHQNKRTLLFESVGWRISFLQPQTSWNDMNASKGIPNELFNTLLGDVTNDDNQNLGDGFHKWPNKTLAQVFSCEFCEIFKNTFFTEHLLATASAVSILLDVGKAFDHASLNELLY